MAGLNIMLSITGCLQGCSEKRLEVTGEWAWLLQAFANQYGVRNNYAVMTHLRWVLRPGVASVSQVCFDLLARQMRGLLEQGAQQGLTQHEVSYGVALSGRQGLCEPLKGVCWPAQQAHERMRITAQTTYEDDTFAA